MSFEIVSKIAFKNDAREDHHKQSAQVGAMAIIWSLKTKKLPPLQSPAGEATSEY
jgi:hypothetical protein